MAALAGDLGVGGAGRGGALVSGETDRESAHSEWPGELKPGFPERGC